MSEETELEVRRLMQQLEHQVIDINRTKIGEIAGEVKQKDFLELAECLSVLRANHLNQVLKLAHTSPNEINLSQIEEIKRHRLLYEEAMEGFTSLRHAMERGYFTLS